MKIKMIMFAISTSIFLGCNDAESGKDTAFQPLENGFGFGQHSKKSYPGHRAIWAECEYRDTNGARTVVWPYIHTFASIQISNKVAVFLGDKANISGDGRERLTTRIIAFDALNG